jgi:hypothetical protein
MSRELCPVCHGAGEYLHTEADPDSYIYSETMETCRSCYGSGFETFPTRRELRESRERLNSSMAALEKAVEAINKRFPKR